MFFILLFCLFGLSSAQNVTLEALRRVISCSLIDEQFVEKWNNMSKVEQFNVCKGYEADEKTRNCIYPNRNECWGFAKHRMLVKKFVDFFFSRLPCHLFLRDFDDPVDIKAAQNAKMKSLFWEIDKREDNNFSATWKAFRNESYSLVDLDSNRWSVVLKRMDHLYWAFQEVGHSRWLTQIYGDRKEFPNDGYSFPFQTTDGDTIYPWMDEFSMTK